MKNNKKEYICILILFIISIFSSNIDSFFLEINPNLNIENITNNYNKELETELNDLKEANNLNKSKLNLKLTKVKYQNIYKYKNNITIYKGTNDNVKINDIVINNEGLIGIITKTFKNTSIVSLITDKNINISVKINDTTGILKSKNNKLYVENIDNYVNINKGDEVFTSGLGIFPKNIYIGKVKDIYLNNSKIEKIIELDINNRLDNLNYLFIRSQND